MTLYRSFLLFKQTDGPTMRIVECTESGEGILIHHYLGIRLGYNRVGRGILCKWFGTEAVFLICNVVRCFYDFSTLY